MSRSSFFFIFLLFGELLTACRREGKETDMRADSVYHVPSSKRQKKNSLISLCVCVCVFCSVFLSNLKWQEMKSAVICVDWDRIKNSLVCKGWKDRCYIGLDSSKMQMLMLSCHFVLLFFFFFFYTSYKTSDWCEFAFYERNIRQGSYVHHQTWLNEMWYLYVCVGPITLKDVTRQQGNCVDTFCCVRVFICQTPCDPTSSRRKALTLG